MKRLAIFFDGTWNSPERAARGRIKPTNVLKLYRALLPVAADGTPQVGLYLEGVGAFIGERTGAGRLQALADRLLGGLYGGGFEGRVKAAARFLAANHAPGDEIHLFGFSRGAAQAASLARFLDWCGGLVAKRDEFYLPELFERFTAARGEGSAASAAYAAIRSRRVGAVVAPGAGDAAGAARTTGTGDASAIADPRPVSITFLGQFDPVLALGSRLRADLLEAEPGAGTVERRLAFHAGRELPANVRVARVALAIDERRWDFRPILWHPPGDLADRLEQRWFVGAHSNVGGGYALDGLANFALAWMASEARGAGLELDAGYLRNFRPNPKGDRPDERRGWLRWSELVRGKSGRGRRTLDAVAGEVDDSALRLLAGDPTYRPENLLDFLRRHPEALAGQPSARKARIDAILGGR